MAKKGESIVRAQVRMLPLIVHRTMSSVTIQKRVLNNDYVESEIERCVWVSSSLDLGRLSGRGWKKTKVN